MRPRLSVTPSCLSLPLLAVLAVLMSWCAGRTSAAPLPQDSSQTKQGTAGTAADSGASGPLLKGKKLVLKDGSYQLVREYQRNGDRVRYFSTERGAWEEIPAAMVDWEATKKAEKLDEQINNALVKQVHIQEAAANAQTPVDVDASLMVAPGAFLPDGEGMFAIEGKKVLRLEQVGSQVKTDKTTVLKQVLTPIPIIPSKHNVEIPGPKATIRLTSDHPEFFLRQPPPDPDRVSSIERSSRVGDTGPEVVLVRAKVKGNKRLLESIRSYFGQQISQERDEISVQRWDVAPDVFRFTLSQALPPGEYAFAELLPDGMNLFVWDFAVDAAPAAKAQAQ
jgi:hypothetical protein